VAALDVQSVTLKHIHKSVSIGELLCRSVYLMRNRVAAEEAIKGIVVVSPMVLHVLNKYVEINQEYAS
jgi:hypothetical protein